MMPEVSPQLPDIVEAALQRAMPVRCEYRDLKFAELMIESVRRELTRLFVPPSEPWARYLIEGTVATVDDEIYPISTKGE